MFLDEFVQQTANELHIFYEEAYEIVYMDSFFYEPDDSDIDYGL